MKKIVSVSLFGLLMASSCATHTTRPDGSVLGAQLHDRFASNRSPASDIARVEATDLDRLAGQYTIVSGCDKYAGKTATFQKYVGMYGFFVPAGTGADILYSVTPSRKEHELTTLAPNEGSRPALFNYTSNEKFSGKFYFYDMLNEPSTDLNKGGPSNILSTTTIYEVDSSAKTIHVTLKWVAEGKAEHSECIFKSID